MFASLALCSKGKALALFCKQRNGEAWFSTDALFLEILPRPWQRPVAKGVTSGSLMKVSLMISAANGFISGWAKSLIGIGDFLMRFWTHHESHHDNKLFVLGRAAVS